MEKYLVKNYCRLVRSEREYTIVIGTVHRFLFANWCLTYSRDPVMMSFLLRVRSTIWTSYSSSGWVNYTCNQRSFTWIWMKEWWFQFSKWLLILYISSFDFLNNYRCWKLLTLSWQFLEMQWNKLRSYLTFRWPISRSTNRHWLIRLLPLIHSTQQRCPTFP